MWNWSRPNPVGARRVCFLPIRYTALSRARARLASMEASRALPAGLPSARMSSGVPLGRAGTGAHRRFYARIQEVTALLRLRKRRCRWRPWGCHLGSRSPPPSQGGGANNIQHRTSASVTNRAPQRDPMAGQPTISACRTSWRDRPQGTPLRWNRGAFCILPGRSPSATALAEQCHELRACSRSARCSTTCQGSSPS
jgi:hypothetical protein